MVRRKPIVCDVLAVPHHGGVIWKGRSERQFEDDLNWLYRDAVRSRHAVISVGTGNGEGHPRRESVRAIRDSVADEKPVVLCTQLTPRCCADHSAFRPGVIHPGMPSLSTLRIGHSTALAGTILAEFGPEKVTVRHVERHQDGVRTGLRQPGAIRSVGRNAESPATGLLFVYSPRPACSSLSHSNHKDGRRDQTS